MKYIEQFDMTDCGAACLAMVASFFGKSISLAKIREKAGTDVVGTNINGLVKAAREYGLKATPLKGDKDAIKTTVPVPFIAHWHITNENDISSWQSHFVVVRKITKNRIEVWNPNPIEGKQKISYEEFFKFWTGYVIFFTTDTSFKKNKKESIIFKFYPIFLPHKKILFYSFLCSSLIIIFGIISSFYYKYVFDEVIFAKASYTLTTLSFGIMLSTITQTIVESVRKVLLSHFSYKTDLQLNFSYISHIFKLPLSFFESRKSGEILSRLGDLTKVKNTLSLVTISGLMDFFLLFLSGPILWKINSKLFSISLITVFVLSCVSVCFSRIYKRLYSKSMTENAEVESYLYESLNGASTVKAFDAEHIVYNEYEKRKMKATEIDWKINTTGIIQNLILGILNGSSGIFIYWIGSLNIISGSFSFGTLITFNALLGYFTNPFFRLVNMQNSIQEALVAARRVGEILELEQEQEDKQFYIKPKSIKGKIEFQNVTFSYGSRKPVYENLSLEIPSSQWTAFVGPSGCGKSTLAKLVLKLYEVEKGKILIDGYDISDIDMKYLRSSIGYVPQDIFLFSGTVEENIKLHYPEASLEEVIMVAKKAGADGFIQKLPKRYNTILGENGGGLSGGERQRLALARALLGKPSLIILDEATSSLDSISEIYIHNVIRNLKAEGISVILIAHRLTTVTACDKIFVMNEGKIIQEGSHDELLSQDGFYKTMWNGVYC